MGKEIYAGWEEETPAIPYGIITGCNWGMEIMLGWWWEYYSRFNSLPVAFLDFGMSLNAVRFCKERGMVIQAEVPSAYLNRRMRVPAQWEKRMREEGIYNRQQYRRLSWFKKPIGLLRTPFQYAAWLDIDCQVRGDLFDLFIHAENEQGFSVAPTDGYNASMHQIVGWDSPKSHFVNSGVVSFKHGSRIIKEWAEAVFHWDQMFFGDQDILGEVLARQKEPFQELPRIYNWRVNKWGENPSALIAHYAGEARKIALREIV